MERNHQGPPSFDFKHLYGLFYSIFSKDLFYTIKWLLLTLYGFIPILIYSFPNNNNGNFLIYEKILLIFFFITSFNPVFSKIKFLELIKVL